MKKISTLLFIIALTIFSSCQPEQPAAPDLDIDANTLVLSKMVAVGNSLTAGIQSAGIVEDFQLHSFPYLVAQQMGKGDEFEMPLVAAPGIGDPPGKTPQSFDPATGAITQDDLTVLPELLLKNAFLSRPYDNLGVPGADLNDILNTTGGGLADLVLRNPNFGNTTQLQQAIGLRPTLLLLWVGSNDVLGAALDGGDMDQITSIDDFTSRLTEILTTIAANLTQTAIIMANVPNVTDIPFVNTLDIIFRDLGLGAVPVLFDATFQPIDFGGGLNLPMYTQEGTLDAEVVTHVTLAGLIAYQSGIGIPDSTVLDDIYGLGPGLASQIVAGLELQGVIPTGIPMPGDMTITQTEESAMKDAVIGFNAVIATAAGALIPVIDANTLLNTLNTDGLEGYSGKYVLLDPAATAFSLDGVHPNNGGHAIIANAFIDAINALPFNLNLPKLNTADYMGQYLAKMPAGGFKLTENSGIDNVRKMFRR